MPIQVQGYKLYFIVLPTIMQEISHSIPMHNSEDFFNFPKVAGIRIINLTSDKIYAAEK